MTEEERQIELAGGSPWGFSIQGGADFGAPLKVTKVSPGGKAAEAGVQLNDVLKRISDRSCGALRHSEALYLIRTSGASLSLVLQKGRAAPAPYQPERHLVRAATVPSHRASRSPPKPSPKKQPPSPQKQPPSPKKRTPSPQKLPPSPKKRTPSPQKLPPSPKKRTPSPLERSPVRSPPSRGESVGGLDWYRAMHRSDQSEEPRPFNSSGEEKTHKTSPQPIKAKPRSATHPGPPNGSAPLSAHSPPKADPSPPKQAPSFPDPSPPKQAPLVPVPQQAPSQDHAPPKQAPSPTQTSPSPPASGPGPQGSPVSPSAPSGPARRRTGPKRRRELKPPPAETARGLYDFAAETKHELSFRRGDRLRLLRTVDENWLEAQLGDKKGIVPASYVELCVPQGAGQGPAREESGPLAVARYEFLAEESYELGFEKGARVALLSRVDDNWLQGRAGGRTGIFPAAFVDILTPLPDPLPPIEDNQPPEGPQPREDSPPSEGVLPDSPPAGDLYRAVYSYSPQNEDELALAPGAEVHVVRRCEDGWFMGYDGSTGAFGTFPGNYVTPI